MDTTPKGKSLRFVKSTSTNTTSNTTPIKEAKKQRFWDHDTDWQDNNDVLWDWDSPKNIKPKALRVKKREIYKSPKLAPKKTSQTDHMKNYEKLKQELQALRDEIARADDCLPLSPVDEQIYKQESADTEINSFLEEQYFHFENQEVEACLKTNDKQLNKDCGDKLIDDLFDDDCDEQLFLCSQMIEEKFNMIGSCSKKTENMTLCRNDINKNVNTICNLNPSKPEPVSLLKIVDYKNIPDSALSLEKNVHSSPIDDSFDGVLKDFEDQDIDILTQASNTTRTFMPKNSPSNKSFKRTISDANVQYISHKNVKPDATKYVFHRTQSFESAPILKDGDLPKHVMEEIERKRKEALARLMERKEKEKRLPKTVHNLKSDNSSIQCSQDEIEKKRLQAKAIREAKQREIMERNRQEAIKRLEMNKRKRIENLKTQVNNV